MMKKAFTLIELMIVVAIIAILAMIAVPMYQKYIERSRNSAAQSMLQQIGLAEMAAQTDGVSNGIPDFIFVKAAGETSEVSKLVEFGFRPDNNVGFHIQKPSAQVGGVVPSGFVAYAAHKAIGSLVYVYDSIGSTGVVEAVADKKYANMAQPTSLFIFKFDGTQAKDAQITGDGTITIAKSGDQVKATAATTPTNP